MLTPSLEVKGSGSTAEVLLDGAKMHLKGLRIDMRANDLPRVEMDLAYLSESDVRLDTVELIIRDVDMPAAFEEALLLRLLEREHERRGVVDATSLSDVCRMFRVKNPPVSA